jgi:deoxyribose-phosphate aldolase
VNFASRIDHTLLDKDASVEKYDEVIEEADAYGTNVCLPPSRLDRVPDGFDGEVVAVVGFPHGTTTPDVKKYEARAAVDKGATEVDMACNVSALVSGEDDRFVRDVRAVAETGVTTKAIVETGVLDEEEKPRAARLCVEAGADYVKTCTGYAEGKATVEDVCLLSEAVGDEARVKASGGIRDSNDAIRMLEAGASRIGTSAGADIVQGYDGTYSP